MKQPVRLGFIGAGQWMRTYHLPAAKMLMESCHVVLQGIWNKTLTKAEGLAKEFPIKTVYTSFEALLEDNAIDAVVIAVSRNISGDFLQKAIDHKKPVLIEKPPAKNAQLAKTLGNLPFDKSLVAFNRSFTPLFHQLKHSLPTRLLDGYCMFHRKMRDDNNFVVETGVHALMTNDLLFGPGVLLECKKTFLNGVPVPRWIAKVQYREASNLIITYDFHPWSDMAVERYSYRFPDGKISAKFNQHYAKDDVEQLETQYQNSDPMYWFTNKFESLEREGYLGEYYAFIDMVTNKRPSKIPVSRAARVMQLAEMIQN